jgi:hypothetical protein
LIAILCLTTPGTERDTTFNIIRSFWWYGILP